MSDGPLEQAADEEDLYATDLDDEIEQEGNRAEGGRAGAVLEFLARSIVEDAEAVVVEYERDRRGLTLRLHVAPEDMGKVIGRRGRVAQAIRTIVRAAASTEGVEASVDIVD